MTREESWQVEGPALLLLLQITSLGYIVSVFRFPSSMLGTIPANVEMHALDLSTDLPTKHVARIGRDEGGDVEYRCACLLASKVGIDLEG